MQTLDLECPSCGEMLELDAGFAGGVCRCSNCGTLMTVPKDAGKAEQLSSSSDGMSSRDDGMGRGGSSRRSAGRSQPAGGRGAAQTIEAGEYRTASGKVIRLEQSVKVPMAKGKQKKIRAATTIVFFGVVLGVVVAAGFAISMIVGGGGSGAQQAGGGENGGEVIETGPTYDATANPYTRGFTNVAGIPVSGKVAVVFESSSNSEDWLVDIADLVVGGLKISGDKPASAALFMATGDKPGVFGSAGFANSAGLDRAGVKQWAGSFEAGLTVNHDAAIGQALSAKPDIMVLVLGGAYPEDVDRWEALAKNHPGVLIHAVMVESSSSALTQWLFDREGSIVASVSGYDVEDWQEEAAWGGGDEEPGDESE